PVVLAGTPVVAVIVGVITCVAEISVEEVIAIDVASMSSKLPANAVVGSTHSVATTLQIPFFVPDGISVSTAAVGVTSGSAVGSGVTRAIYEAIFSWLSSGWHKKQAVPASSGLEICPAWAVS
ncbi:MAG: hypothetical protein H6Q38_3284, partial [Chloroflexi bacterium]|nr:hypothetical protein [Chloroflexota bacterium]